MACSRCRMLRMWDVGYVGRGDVEMFEMWDVGDMGCSVCGVFGIGR